MDREAEKDTRALIMTNCVNYYGPKNKCKYAWWHREFRSNDKAMSGEYIELSARVMLCTIVRLRAHLDSADADADTPGHEPLRTVILVAMQTHTREYKPIILGPGSTQTYTQRSVVSKQPPLHDTTRLLACPLTHVR